ncbi:MAG: hypothetical protein C0483_18235 [Pirellula sp.]|nr:hypothetical protein [Pirellula sp.]
MSDTNQTRSAHDSATSEEHESHAEEFGTLLELDAWKLCFVGAWFLMIAFLVVQQVAKAFVVTL